MKKLNMLIPIALLGGCTEKGAVEDAVKDFLIDPDSAKFGEITIVDTAAGKKACATTNAKNRMGGYTGDKQITLFYNEDLEKWAAINDWEITHKMCIDIISDKQEEADEEAAEEASEANEGRGNAPRVEASESPSMEEAANCTAAAAADNLC